MLIFLSYCILSFLIRFQATYQQSPERKLDILQIQLETTITRKWGTGISPKPHKIRNANDTFWVRWDKNAELFRNISAQQNANLECDVKIILGNLSHSVILLNSIWKYILDPILWGGEGGWSYTTHAMRGRRTLFHLLRCWIIKDNTLNVFITVACYKSSL